MGTSFFFVCPVEPLIDHNVVALELEFQKLGVIFLKRRLMYQPLISVVIFVELA